LKLPCQSLLPKNLFQNGSRRGCGELRLGDITELLVPAVEPAATGRWERLPEIHQAFMSLGCAVICQRYLRAM
jgi:hypothetical protein